MIAGQPGWHFPSAKRLKQKHKKATSYNSFQLESRLVITFVSKKRSNYMTTFDEREKGFEKKFAHDAELKFKAESRRNKMLAEWAGAKMGMAADQIAEYVKEVRRADLEEAGDDDVFRKVRADLDAKSVAVSDQELRDQMHEFLAKAVSDVEASS